MCTLFAGFLACTSNSAGALATCSSTKSGSSRTTSSSTICWPALRKSSTASRVAGTTPQWLALPKGGRPDGVGPGALLSDALIPALEEVGARFERGDFFVPEMLIAGKAMAGALEMLRPLLAETGAETIGKIVMGTVKGDVHDIGKNLVNIMFEGAGFEVIDLGVQVAPEKFVAAIEK